MTKKEVDRGRAVHRIDLALPIVQTNAYDILCSIPSSHNLRTTLHQKPLIDNNKKTTNQPTRIRSPPRLKHLLGPSFINLFVNVNTMTAETASTITETVSNPLLYSNARDRLLKVLPTFNKRNKQKSLKDDDDRSRSSSGDRLLYESIGSFDDQNKYKSKNNNIWQNIHHPQLTSTKALHTRRMSKRSLNSTDASSLKVSNTTSFDTLSQESTNDQLYERIEQLTKSYFPTIQKLRHSCPNSEVVSNRMYLHRVQDRNFMPVLSRTRVVR